MYVAIEYNDGYDDYEVISAHAIDSMESVINFVNESEWKVDVFENGEWIFDHRKIPVLL